MRGSFKFRIISPGDRVGLFMIDLFLDSLKKHVNW